MVVDLIHSDGKVDGAFGFNIMDGTFYVFNAKAIVIANGSLTLNTLGNPSHTGDGMAMALRAGAELRNMEFTGTAVAPIGPPTFMQRGFRPEPEYLITNALGEDYLQKYEETKRLLGRRYAGPPWRRQTRVTLHEWMEGRGPTYVEFVKPPGTTYSSLIREYWGSGFDRQLKWFEDRGYTALDKLQYDLVLRFGEGAGGIGINSDCETTVPGLYAGGSVLGPWGWGATGYIILSGLTNAAVMGYRAGESAAKHALAQTRRGRISAGRISQLREATYALLEHKGIVPDELRLKIAKAWVNLDVRDEARLEKAQVELQTLEKEAANLSADDYHELEKCHKIKSLILCARAVASAAQVRKETRLLHIRLDYPLRDNKNWLKWTITRLVGDNVHTDVRNLPIERWKYKPEPTLVDPLRPATKEAQS
jgi:succinate dehydrogenase/fumarate reductase flavoprotein subunit